MGISQFNRSNPMIILMRRVNDEFTTASLTAAKQVIRRVLVQFVLQAVILVFLIVRVIRRPASFTAVDIWLTIVAFVIISIAIFFNFFAVVHCGRNRKMKEINDMIYGENYSVADVNNEDVLKVITDLEFMMGRLDGVSSMMLFWHGMILASQFFTITYLIRL